jgi:polyhydroxyalkanoate synthase
MNADGGEDFGSRVCREFAQFVDDALARREGRDNEPSSAGKRILFLIDEAQHLLTALRSELHGKAASAGHAKAASEAATGSASPFRGKGLVETLQLIVAQAIAQPRDFATHYAAFAEEALKIFSGASDLKPDLGDHRFKDRMWGDGAVHRALLQLYLAWKQSMQDWLNKQTLDEFDRKRVAFIFDQITAAIAPSNLPLNPAALKRARDTDGESAVSGVHNWVSDLISNHAMPRQIRPDAYQVGRDLGISEGAVIYRNEQLELIQYCAGTPSVRRRPILLVPPQINKYYIFDLRPKSSVIGHLIRSGLQMFSLSWRNPTKTEAHWSLDTYVEATLQAIEVIRSTTKSRKVGMISGCAGGLTAMAVLGYLAEIDDPRISSHSLLVTSLFPTGESPLELFATPEMTERVRRYSNAMGTMEGAELAKIFAWLRPNDLVWRYWVNNYLMGRNPPPLDVLYWDNDSTRLPATLNDDFIDMYDRDVFRRPNALKVLDRPIDFRKVRVNSYFVGGADDYLMPWEGCYEACRVFRGQHEFVLSPSGHVQSVLRPPRLANTLYYTNAARPNTPQEWMRTATRHDGSWWDHWHRWLASQSGTLKNAPHRLGSKEFPPLMAAPGSYVHMQ